MGSIASSASLAGLLCLLGCEWPQAHVWSMDDTLDVFGVHGVGGILGALLTGVFAAPSLGRHRHLRLCRQQGCRRLLDHRPAVDPVPGRGDHGHLVRQWWRSSPYKIVDAIVGLRVPEEGARGVWTSRPGGEKLPAGTGPLTHPAKRPGCAPGFFVIVPAP
ncbi:hypothetical protein ACU4HD_47085 [Cupriavidus basilensis]